MIVLYVALRTEINFDDSDINIVPQLPLLNLTNTRTRKDLNV